MKWDEIYHILEWEWEIEYWKVEIKDWKAFLFKSNIKKVFKWDIFNIEEWYSHSLKRLWKNKLIIWFICPHTHLTTDRILIEDNNT